MRHDTFYYGGEIIDLINTTLSCHPIMDRGGKYVWEVPCSAGKIVYCDMMENDNRGCLEVHEFGKFKDQLDYRGILTSNEDDSDYYFTDDRKKKVEYFLEKHLKDGREEYDRRASAF